MDTVSPSQELPIEKRVATLEQQMADILRSRPMASRTAGDDWVTTVGTWQDDALSREADQLGEESARTLHEQATQLASTGELPRPAGAELLISKIHPDPLDQ